MTIPYKTTMLAICDDLTEAAAAIGSVNTVVKQLDGSLLGDNTDAAGFEGMVWKSRMRILGRKCLVLGSGGASLSVQYVLRKLGAGEIVVISRTGEDNYTNLDRHRDASILVNTTPVGMYPNTAASPVDLLGISPVRGGSGPDPTTPPAPRCSSRRRHWGFPGLGGLYMLAEQARCAAQIFTGEVIPAIRTKEAYHALSRRKENRILIGMPGCGKSTVGQALAQRLDRPFVDCDQELERILEMPVGEYITHYGEEAFRAQETALLTQLGKASGLVIATGGGCVTRPENYPHLHQNGAIIFLERELSKLPKKGRPLSLRGSLQDMYTIRLPMYRRFADITVANDGPAETVAQTVEEAYEHFSD